MTVKVYGLTWITAHEVTLWIDISEPNFTTLALVVLELKLVVGKGNSNICY